MKCHKWKRVLITALFFLECFSKWYFPKFKAMGHVFQLQIFLSMGQFFQEQWAPSTKHGTIVAFFPKLRGGMLGWLEKCWTCGAFDVMLRLFFQRLRSFWGSCSDEIIRHASWTFVFFLGFNFRWKKHPSLDTWNKDPSLPTVLLPN